MSTPDSMSDLAGLTHSTFGRKKMNPFAGKQAPPFTKKGAAADPKKKPFAGIGKAIGGKKKGSMMKGC